MVASAGSDGARSLVDHFIEAADHWQLQQRDVAREVVHLLRIGHITPPMLMRNAKALGLGSAIEAANLLATWMMDDGWIHHSHRPYVGSGLGSVWSYVPTRKWRRFSESVSRPRETDSRPPRIEPENLNTPRIEPENQTSTENQVLEVWRFFYGDSPAAGDSPG